MSHPIGITRAGDSDPCGEQRGRSERTGERGEIVPTEGEADVEVAPWRVLDPDPREVRQAAGVGVRLRRSKVLHVEADPADERGLLVALVDAVGADPERTSRLDHVRILAEGGLRVLRFLIEA